MDYILLEMGAVFDISQKRVNTLSRHRDEIIGCAELILKMPRSTIIEAARMTECSVPRYDRVKSTKRRMIDLMKSVVLLAVFAGSGQVAAQSAKAEPAKAPAASVFQEQASKLGVRQCANLFAALGETVSNGAAYTVQTQTGGSAPDGHGVQGVIGMAYNTPGYTGQAAGVVLAAPVGPKCEGQLVRVAPFQRACKDVLAMLPAGSTAAGSLSGVPLYNLGGNQGQAMLVSSGNACVVVTIARGADAG